MAELMKNLKKKTVRAKESFLVSLGKQDRTTDETFEEHCADFTKQQKNGDRLQKELKNYVACLKALNQASKGFNEAIREVYEPQWDEVDHVKAITHSLDLLWDDYLEKMNDQALSPLNSYCSNFVDVKAKIDKRRRKLVDFDSARHNYDSVLASGKKDDKLQKAQEQLTEAKKLYEDLNRELMTELPELYDGRIGFTVNHFQTIFNAEHTFHTETGKLSKELNEKISKIKLGTPPRRNTPPPRNNSLSRPPQPTKRASPRASPGLPVTNSNHDNEVKESPEKRSSVAAHQPAPTTPVVVAAPIVEPAKPKSEEKVTLYPSISHEKVPTALETRADSPDNNPFGDDDDDEHQASPKKEKIDENGHHGAGVKVLKKDSELPDSPPHYEPPKEVKAEIVVETKKSSDAVVAPEKPKCNVLYKVRATHRYAAEDTDELSFEAGDIISVVPCEDPDEQDDGWLTGFKETNGEKGVFPANFTKPL